MERTDALALVMAASDDEEVNIKELEKAVKTVKTEILKPLEDLVEQVKDMAVKEALKNGTEPGDSFEYCGMRFVFNEKTTYKQGSEEMIEFAEIHYPGIVKKDPTIPWNSLNKVVKDTDPESRQLLIDKGLIRVDKKHSVKIV